jgi:hypothetical protein
LLGRIDQSPGGAGLRPQSLDRTHHVTLLREECLSRLLGPSKVFIHPFNQIWIMHQIDHAIVPALVIDFCHVPIVVQIPRGHDHIRGNSGRWQDQRNQCVWIKRDRAVQFIKFRGRTQSRRGVIGQNLSHRQKTGKNTKQK